MFKAARTHPSFWAVAAGARPGLCLDGARAHHLSWAVPGSPVEATAAPRRCGGGALRDQAPRRGTGDVWCGVTGAVGLAVSTHCTAVPVPMR